MSPTRVAWYPFSANVRTAASRICRRFSSEAIDRSVNAGSVVVGSRAHATARGPPRRRLHAPAAGAVREPRADAPGRAGREGRAAGGRVDARRRAGVVRRDQRRQGDRRARPQGRRARRRRRSCATSADVILDGFRPGVFERLGLRVPETRRLLRDHRLRRRRDGMRQRAGHDINYIGWAGAAGRHGARRPARRRWRISPQARSARSSRSSPRCSSASGQARGGASRSR